MTYKVEIPRFAQSQFDNYVYYILDKFKSKQAARNLVIDFKDTIKLLSQHPEAYPLLENEYLKGKNLRHIPFQKHRYVVIYHVLGEDKVYVDAIYHTLQDYMNLLR